MSSRFVSPRVAAVPPSGIRRFFDVAGTMKDAISLGVGEPDFVTPYHIRNAAIDSLLDGETQYTPNRGLLSLRREIALYLEKRFGVSYDPEQEIMVTVGASEAIDLALRVCIQPGDALEAAITPNTRALVFPYPNNPTGAVMNREQMAAIAQVASVHDLLVISDEIYGELTYAGERAAFASLPGMKERTVTINGFSKAFAMTGWRLGFACAPKDILYEMNKIHQYAIMCAPRQAQVAGEQALRRGRENDYEDIAVMRSSYDRRRRVMLDAFHKMGLSCFEPRGAFYCFPSIQSTGLSSEEFCTRLLREKKVVCVPGDAFGSRGAGHIRCCYATDLQRMLEAFDRMAQFIQSL